jgi:lipopolysaccharide/colanic/teichoic acid biosynthesis glycosyltransferase
MWRQRLAAGALLVLAAPIIGLAVVATKLESPGPVFFRQTRVGRRRGAYEHEAPGSRTFGIYKLRTMRLGAEADREQYLHENRYRVGPFFKLTRDPRTTTVGRMLRRLGLDELPQLVNVLRGEMSLVGNRPLPTYEADGLGLPWERLRFEAPAGITGLWQVKGHRSPHWRQRLFLDNYYALHRDWLLDLKILAATLPSMLAARGRS